MILRVAVQLQSQSTETPRQYQNVSTPQTEQEPVGNRKIRGLYKLLRSAFITTQTAVNPFQFPPELTDMLQAMARQILPHLLGIVLPAVRFRLTQYRAQARCRPQMRISAARQQSPLVGIANLSSILFLFHALEYLIQL